MKKPAKPIKTVKPVKPAKTATAPKAARTAKPDKAARPIPATKPAGTAKSVKAAKSARTAKPVKVAKPAKAARPVKAVKPVRTARSTTAATATLSTTQPKMPPKTTSEFKNFSPYTLKKGEDYMNEAQKEHFRVILRNWRSELMTEVDSTVSHMKDEAANFPDPADRATQEEEFSLELRTRDRERKLIKKIESTLDLIDQNDYGYCDACGVDIGIKRLEARPTATLCIDCKTLEEIKERQERG